MLFNFFLVFWGTLLTIIESKNIFNTKFKSVDGRLFLAPRELRQLVLTIIKKKKIGVRSKVLNFFHISWDRPLENLEVSIFTDVEFKLVG